MGKLGKNLHVHKKKADGGFCFRQQTVNEDSRKGKQVRQRKHEVANIYQLFASPKVAVHETYPPSSWLFHKHADTRPVGNNSIYVWGNEKRKVFLNLIRGRRASLPLLMENSRGMQQFRRSWEMKRSPKPASTAVVWPLFSVPDQLMEMLQIHIFFFKSFQFALNSLHI